MKKNALFLTLPILILLDPAIAADSPPCTATSGPGTTVLLELYTSEGCSSCPPADRWLSSLAPDGLVPKRVVPLSLHVDYWNYLGWRDPFSQHRFTERQVAYKTRAGARGVYTPQMFVNGKEYLGWHRRQNLVHALGPANRQVGRADIQLRLTPSTQTSLDVRTQVALREKHGYERMGVYLALYENRLGNRVRSGENRGENLRHDHVVRELTGPLPLKPDGRLKVAHRFRIAPDWKPANLGVVVFVQDRANGEVLQTVALDNCR